MLSKELLSIDEGLDTIEHGAEENNNLELLLLVRILREVREVKELLQTRNNSCDCGNNCTNGTDKQSRERNSFVRSQNKINEFEKLQREIKYIKKALLIIAFVIGGIITKII